MTNGVLAADRGTGNVGNVVFDLDGCLYVGDQAVPGARDAIAALEAGSWRIVVATNNSTRHPRVVSAHLADITGIEVPPDRVLTSGGAALRLLSAGDGPVMVVGEEGLRDTVEEAGMTLTDDPAAAAAVLVGLDRRFDYDSMSRGMEAVLRGARFVATNADATFPTGGIPAPGAGAIVAALERATGKTPEYAGKPHEPMRRAIESTLGDGPTWMVGDRVDTDVAMGKAAGWATVLVMTGVTHVTSTIPPGLTPDHVIGSVAELAELMAPG